ncbi:unnamed protein product [Protopolystoma xenopodis]|uniref:Uncharacterized protein n=1 Tax=Protopolystoma xenopodis TaxID=117903 RepID=A0A3S5BDC0_9PLAT|nr:unnamed protein product [Protopolystoma xenopodis]
MRKDAIQTRKRKSKKRRDYAAVAVAAAATNAAMAAVVSSVTAIGLPNGPIGCVSSSGPISTGLASANGPLARVVGLTSSSVASLHSAVPASAATSAGLYAAMRPCLMQTNPASLNDAYPGHMYSHGQPHQSHQSQQPIHPSGGKPA